MPVLGTGGAGGTRTSSMETSSLAADIFSVRIEDSSAAEMSPFFAATGLAWKARCGGHNMNNSQ